MRARLGLEGVMIYGEREAGEPTHESHDSLHRFRLEFLNPHKSFILVRKYCFGCLEQLDETAVS